MRATTSTTTIVSSIKVLLVEDNPGDARLVEIYLAESDFKDCEVVNKTTLEEAFAILKADDSFDVVLLDLSLPDSRGFETLEKVLARFPHINVIVLTGLSDKEIGLKAVKTGAQDFLIKGAFDSDLLSKSLRFSIERSRVLKKLAEAQRLAHIGNWEFFTATNILLASEEMYRIFGCKEHYVSAHISQLDDCLLKSLEEIHHTAALYNEFKGDLKIVKNDGSICHAYAQCIANQNPEGEVVFQGIIQDITERKLAEQEMIKSRERYQEIFTQSKDALFICTLDGKFIDFNQSTTDLFGLSAEELLNVKDVHALYHPVERKNEFLLKLKAQKSVKDYEINIVLKNGEFRECLINANFIVTDGDLGYNCILRDVTEQRQAEKLRKARDLAQQTARMKEQFLASISHEMRTPMNAIFGMSNLLEHTKLDEEQRDLINSIKNSSELLLGIVNDILEISAIQNGKVNFENVPFDLYALLNNLTNVMQYKAQEKDIFLEVVLDEDIPVFISGDKLRLNQVLYNLVGNAIKFTDEGYVKIFVKKLYDIGESVQLQFVIEDTGIGIPDDKIEAVFETFTRIKQKDRIYEGTGLGLSICKNLIEQQGGKIGAISALDKGSRFFFDLIFDKARQDEQPVEDIPHKNTESPFDDDTRFSLLLVEDHKMNQIVAKKTLEKKWANIAVTIAENGQIAIDLLQNQDFDIVLMDLQMPLMDGYEATQRIRNEFPAEKANLPILAMTAHAHIAKEQKFREIGMDDFVLKPFEPEDLFYKIKKYVQKKKP